MNKKSERIYHIPFVGWDVTFPRLMKLLKYLIIILALAGIAVSFALKCYVSYDGGKWKFGMEPIETEIRVNR